MDTFVDHLCNVRAFDLGTPSLSGRCSLHIHILDENDNPPVFEQPSYSVSVPEDTSAGETIINVRARDLDGTRPNKDILYRWIAFILNVATPEKWAKTKKSK